MSSEGCPPSVGSIRLRVHKQMWFEDFQDGRRAGHLEYQNGMILTILNLHVARNASHQVWTQSELVFGSRCGLKIFKMAAMAMPPWRASMPPIKFRRSPTYGLGGDVV